MRTKIAEKVTYERIKKVINGYKNLKIKIKLRRIRRKFKILQIIILTIPNYRSIKSIFAKKMKSLFALKKILTINFLKIRIIVCLVIIINIRL